MRIERHDQVVKEHSPHPHRREHHTTHRVGWLRAAVLGANDGIISTSSLLVGVAAGNASRDSILLAGIAGLVAGAMSMAAGEYVSVSSQADAEASDLEIEKFELANDVEGEIRELAGIYAARGVDPELARKVALQLMKHDALDAHARDELGFTPHSQARPLQAALASAVAFAFGALWPLGLAFAAPVPNFEITLIVGTLIALAVLGSAAARTGGAPPIKGAVRVVFWGAVAMAATALIGRLLGTTVL